MSSDDLNRWMLDYFCEQTGVPTDVLDGDVRLEEFLGLDGDRLTGLLADLEDRAAAPGLGQFALSARRPELTIGLLAGYVEEHRRSRTNGAHAVEAAPQAPDAQAEMIGTGTARSESRSMRRLVLRTLEESLPADAPAQPKLTGSVVVVGNGPIVEALCDRLAPLGPVRSIVWSSDGAALAAEPDGGAPPATVLVIASLPGEAATGEAGWGAGETAAFAAGAALVQHWLRRIEEAGLVEQAALVAVTSLGGDFGFRNPIPSPVGGAWTGLLKGLSAEHEGRLLVKTLDAAPGEPAKMVASAVVRELAVGRSNDSAAREVEVGCVRGRREVVRAVPQPAEILPVRSLTRGAVWVATGGATGITARAAAELARQFGLTLHLIGSTPYAPPDESIRGLDAAGLRDYRLHVMRAARAAGRAPDEAWGAVERTLEIDATLRRMVEDGIAAVYHACDVADAGALASTLEEIRAAGPIRGVIHGAGFEKPGRFVKKSADVVSRTLAAKVEGAANLLRLTANDPLEAFVAFGSLCGRFGGQSQVDYSAASDLLAKLVAAERSRRPDARLVTIHWPPWDEVGISVRADHRFLLDHAGVRRMPVSEGVAHFVREVAADTRDAEITFLEPDAAARGLQARLAAVPTAERSARLEELQTAARRLPLIDDVVLRSSDSGTAAMTFDPACDPFLTGHRDEGVPLLPAVIALEAAAEAACLLTRLPYVAEIRDIKLVQGFRMSLPMRYRADLHAERKGNTATCRLTGAYLTAEGRLADPGRVYQTMTVVTADAPPQLPAAPRAPCEGDWVPVAYSRDWRDPPPLPLRTIFYGPALSTLREINYGTRGAIDSPDASARKAAPAVAWGRFTAPAPDEIGGRRAGRDWKTCPALFDGALVVGNLQAVHLVGGMQLPLAIDRVRYGRLPRAGEKCVSQVRFFGRENRQYLFEIWLVGESGETLLHAEGVRFVDRTASLGPAAPRSG